MQTRYINTSHHQNGPWNILNNQLRFPLIYHQFYYSSLSILSVLPTMRHNSDITLTLSFPVGSVVKNPHARAGDVSLVPRSRRSPGGGNGNPLQYSCLRTQGLEPAGLLCSWCYPSKNTGVGCHFLLQGIFPTQASNLHLPPWQVDSLPLNDLGSPFLNIFGY